MDVHIDHAKTAENRKGSPIQQTLAGWLDDLNSWPGRIVNLLIALLVVFSSALYVVETYPIPALWRFRLHTIDTVIVSLFTLEYLLRIISTKKKIAFLFSFYSLVDLLTIVPFLLGIANIQFIRIFRVFRWFRILRLIRFFDGSRVWGSITRQDSLILVRILFSLFSIVFVYSGLIFQVEHPINGKVFQTFLDAIYFAVVTMTTVGFGDVIPITQAGRLLTVLMILTGIAVIPWQVGDLIKQLVKPTSMRLIPCPQCRHTPHDLDALFCNRCGSPLILEPLEGV